MPLSGGWIRRSCFSQLCFHNSLFFFQVSLFISRTKLFFVREFLFWFTLVSSAVCAVVHRSSLPFCGRSYFKDLHIRGLAFSARLQDFQEWGVKAWEEIFISSDGSFPERKPCWQFSEGKLGLRLFCLWYFRLCPSSVSVSTNVRDFWLSFDFATTLLLPLYLWFWLVGVYSRLLATMSCGSAVVFVLEVYEVQNKVLGVSSWDLVSPNLESR